MVRSGFARGVDLVNMPDAALSDHLTGFVNGLLVSPLLDGPPECYEQLWRCLESRSNQQLVAIVRAYLRENPEKWHISANIIEFNAIALPCTGNQP